jgi:putative transposase
VFRRADIVRGWPVLSRSEGRDVQQARYYDFNPPDLKEWSEQKRAEKLRYIHRNPVKRGLVERPEDWFV